MNNLNISQTDPDWDYSEVWQSLHIAQNKIDAGIKFISDQETGDDATDQKLKEILKPALEHLESVIENDLTNYSDDHE
ncbi:MAG: hypothetical protein V7L00_20435 [Nostoc sp.]|uniref:hypothetical protein n=1 Tax=Nostoc sp. TaxID=1180 RepID=UPI002FF48661